MGKRVLAISAIVLFGLAVAGLGVCFAVIGLADADMLASVVSAIVALAGLVVSGYGVLLARRASRSPAAPAGQTVDRVDAGGGVAVIDTVGGNVRAGMPPRPPADRPEAGRPPPATGPQSVTDVRADGSVRVVRGVSGDVEVGE